VSVSQLDYPAPYLLIDGEKWPAAGRETREVMNPASGQVIAELPLASGDDLDRALEAARRSSSAWRATPASERGRILKEAARLLLQRSEAIARIATIEEGKSIHETRIEAKVAANSLEWFGEEARRAYGRVLQPAAPGNRALVVKEPVGVVAAFAPWNFPIVNPARKLGAALAAGCPCILKPAEEAPASALAVAQTLLDAGVPPGVLAVVFGHPAQVSEHLLASEIVRKISFTGSIPVGQRLLELAAKGMKRTTMELGGHAPVVIFDDADLDRALELTVAGKFRNAGQVCVAPTRFVVQNNIHDRFVKGFVERTRAIPVGDGLDERNRMGPLAHARRPEAIARLIHDARAKGAVLREGGETLDRPGLFWKPTVLTDVPLSARLMNEEPFGPIATFTRFGTLEESIQEANRLPFGLAAYVFTQSLRTATAVGDAIEAGMIGINTTTISVPESPFGGVKHSGHGSEMGIEGLEAHLTTKFINQV